MQLPDFFFVHLVVVLIVEGGPSDRFKGETGNCCNGLRFFFFFFFFSLSLSLALSPLAPAHFFLRLLVCAEPRDDALLFSCGHPVAWWYLRRRLHLTYVGS